MAAVSIPPSPQVLSTMTNRRVPLANVPNAANSPYRAVGAAATKRQRAYAADQKEVACGPPPAKKQIIEVDDSDSRRFVSRRTHAQPTALQRKLEAARDPRNAQSQRAADHHHKARIQEDVRQWREHYRKVFPSMVFYFDAIPDDTRSRISRQIRTLGAREEKFFSKTVTHVVTTRAIPKDKEPTNASEARVQHPTDSRDAISTSKTINPSLLDRSGEFGNQSHLRTNFTFEAALQKKAQFNPQPYPADIDPRRQQTGNGDILFKAKEMNMKLWALEKLQRMLTTLFEVDEDDQASHVRATRSTVMALRRAGREADLSQLLQKEKLTGPADRDMTVATQEMIPLRGCYVYVYDMDEKTKPVMIREYPVPSKKEDGKWPQLRSTGSGKCPFVEDPSYIKKTQQQEQQRAQAKLEQTRAASARTRAATAEPTYHDAAGQEERRVLADSANVPRRASNTESPTESADMSKPLEPPKLIPAKRPNQDAMPPMFNSTQARRLRMLPRYAGGEPVASGVQPSNITSAIRSHAISSISSTAAVPGARAATSKEVHQLKRKVFEKTSGPSVNSVPSSHLNDVRAAINQERAAPPRAAKRKAQESLAGITEEMSISEKEAAEKRLALLRRKKVVEKDPKPGYCENCREKFNDFDDHVMSRKHRKFATTLENWKELDELLEQLDRPLAPGYRTSKA